MDDKVIQAFMKQANDQFKKIIDLFKEMQKEIDDLDKRVGALEKGKK